MSLRREPDVSHADSFARRDGYGGIPRAVLPGPRVSIPSRSHLLFRGPLQEAGLWVPGEERGDPGLDTQPYLPTDHPPYWRD